MAIITLNGTKRFVGESALTYEKIADMATYPIDTVTYAKAVGPKSHGTLAPGEVVIIDDGTIINATATSSS